MIHCERITLFMKIILTFLSSNSRRDNCHKENKKGDSMDTESFETTINEIVYELKDAVNRLDSGTITVDVFVTKIKNLVNREELDLVPKAIKDHATLCNELNAVLALISPIHLAITAIDVARQHSVIENTKDLQIYPIAKDTNNHNLLLDYASKTLKFVLGYLDGFMNYESDNTTGNNGKHNI